MSTIDNIRQKTRIPVTDSNALSTPTADGKNYLLWLRGAALLAQEFDPGSLKFSGAPQVIANPVGTSGNTAFMHVSASNTGVLVYHRAGLTRFTWFDRTGRSQGDFGEPADYGTFRLSPDGRVVAASKLTPGGSDLWMIDLNRGISTPFSVGPSSHLYPVWSSNNDAVVFEGPRFGLMRKATSGATKEQDILPPSGLQIPHDISRDGKTLIYSSQQRIWAIAVTLDGKPQADAKPRLYLEKGSNTNSPRFSPEPTPRWVAYQSNDSGRDEIEIQSYPEPHGTIRISPSGGRWPHWSPDGRELFYISAENKLMAVDLKTTGSTLEPSVPRELFMLPGADNSFSPYEVSPDGQRFLIRSPAGQADRTLTVVVNWTGLLRQAPPAE
jgi:Tol biopolymer transport system component